MAVKDYTHPVYEKLCSLSSQIDVFKAYVYLIPESDERDSAIQIIRHHSDLIDASMNDVWERFSGMSCGLMLSYDVKEADYVQI
jgi:hypothetical protein